jgi:hypothetical protein
LAVCAAVALADKPSLVVSKSIETKAPTPNSDILVSVRIFNVGSGFVYLSSHSFYRIKDPVRCAGLLSSDALSFSPLVGDHCVREISILSTIFTWYFLLLLTTRCRSLAAPHTTFWLKTTAGQRLILPPHTVLLWLHSIRFFLAPTSHTTTSSALPSQESTLLNLPTFTIV